MGIKCNVTDSATGVKAEVDDTIGERRALVVATRPLKKYINDVRFFTNDAYGSDANQNALNASILHIHNGIDSALWTATAISGNWVFNSTDQAYEGTRSIDGTSTTNDSVAQIAKGSAQDLSGYSSLTGWIYITGWSQFPSKEVRVYGWNTGTGTQVGTVVDIGDYVNTTSLNNWQNFSIPLSDMSLTGQTIDAIRIRTIRTGFGFSPNYYLDNLGFVSVGAGSVEFSIRPDIGKNLFVNKVQMTIIDDYSGTVADGTMPSLPYDSLLGVPSLDAGISFRVVRNGNTEVLFIFKNLGDIITFPGIRLHDYGSDGTNTWAIMSMDWPAPIELNERTQDKISFTINDDLSDLISLKFSAISVIEE